MARSLWLPVLTVFHILLLLNLSIVPLINGAEIAEQSSNVATPAPNTIQSDFQVVIGSDNDIQLQRRDGAPIVDDGRQHSLPFERMDHNSNYDMTADVNDIRASNHRYADDDEQDQLNKLNNEMGAIDLQRITHTLVNSGDNVETSSFFRQPSPQFTAIPATTTVASSTTTTPSTPVSEESFAPSSNTNIFTNQNVFQAKPTHRHVKALPSFSKMPDHLFDQLRSNDIADSSEDTPSYTQGKTLVVPTGSRIHTIKYVDYPETVVNHVIHSPKRTSTVAGKSASSAEFADDEPETKPYEPVIELSGSRPILPIVFNFRTSSNPAMSKHTLQTFYNSQPIKSNHTPATKFYRSEAPPQYAKDVVVHKPIVENVHETITPYVHKTEYPSPVYQTPPQYPSNLHHFPLSESEPSYYPIKIPKYSSVEYAPNSYSDYLASSAPAVTPLNSGGIAKYNKFNYPMQYTPMYVPETSMSYGNSNTNTNHNNNNPFLELFYPYYSPYQSSASMYQNRYSVYHPTPNHQHYPGRYPTRTHYEPSSSNVFFTQTFPKLVQGDYLNYAAYNRYK